MNFIISKLEKMKPFFEKMSRNIYLRAVKDGFLACMPIVLFSSIFMLVAVVPNIFNFYWPANIEASLMKAYTFTMGAIALFVSGTTARSLTEAMNRDLPNTTQINPTSVMMASMASVLLVSLNPVEGGFSLDFIGSKGMITAFLSAFIVTNIYKFTVKNNISINMPKEVPHGLSQSFRDLFPFAFSVTFFWIVDIVVRYFSGMALAEMIIVGLSPLFSAADSYLGLAIIYFAMAFLWFIGIHGPSVVEPAIIALCYINNDANFALLQAGKHASNVLTPGLTNVALFGGTGATFILPIMLLFFTKSKQMKAVGRASVIPGLFSVNEPLMFGIPLILNPTFMVPFILTPIINSWIFKFFVDVLSMNSFSYILPWCTPGPLWVIMGTGFVPLSFVLVIVLLVVDFGIYYPFVKIYDAEQLQIEAENLASEEEDVQGEIKTDSLREGLNVLVLCAGGGTSGLLASAIDEASKEKKLGIGTFAGAYGSHHDILKDYDLVILAPQVASNFEDIKKDTDRLGIKLVSTTGKKYIELTRNADLAIQFVNEQFAEGV